MSAHFIVGRIDGATDNTGTVTMLEALRILKQVTPTQAHDPWDTGAGGEG
jgi:hypothetical protein